MELVCSGCFGMDAGRAALAIKKMRQSIRQVIGRMIPDISIQCEGRVKSS